MNLIDENNETKYLKLSKKELGVITSSLVEFDQEMYWALQQSVNKYFFREMFYKKYSFSLDDLELIRDSLSMLNYNLRDINISDIIIYLSKKKPKKPQAIYAALSEFNMNYEDYEISIRMGISRTDLNTVLQEFKEKVMDKLHVPERNIAQEI